ncbi:MAG: murein L,D-transpeptidase YafK [Gammaproteobacteria bacterium]|jgi:murein L,D-transpeptidase YafK
MVRNYFLILIFGFYFHVGVIYADESVSNLTSQTNLQFKHEKILVTALEEIRLGNIDKAIESIKVIVDTYPTYRLAQLMYADLLMAKSYPIREFGNYQSAPYEQISALLDEAKSRWSYQKQPPPLNKIPSSLVQLSENQPYAVIVDMSTSRLYIYRNDNGVPILEHDFYVTIGKNGTGKIAEGDQKTPVGVYYVTGSIDAEKLPDLYGIGAFPIDYPNEWDKRHGRTGYGIWLHGTPSYTLNRPPRDSDGCVILSNGDLLSIAPYIQGNTPVILTEKIGWIDKKHWLDRQPQYISIIDQWRRDWESRNPELYLNHYSTTYSGLGMNYQSWVEYKRRVNPSKGYIKVGISEKSIFVYPGEPDLIIVTFKQRYESDNLVRDFVKRQYWRMEKDGQWRIVYEGSVS